MGNFDDTIGIWDDITEPNGIDLYATPIKSVQSSASGSSVWGPVAPTVDVCTYYKWQFAFELSKDDVDYIERHETYGGGYDRALEERRQKALKHWQKYSRQHHHCHLFNQLSLSWVGTQAGFKCEPCEQTYFKSLRKGEKE
jgi:hypothetical protein